MAKRKRSGNAGAAAAQNNSSSGAKRARVDDGDGETAQEKAALLSDRSLFAATMARADHDRERRLYKLLGSADVHDRIQAAGVIVSALVGDSSGDSSGGSSGEKSEKSRACVPEPVLLRHLERRLLRGLASGNDAARVGFSYVLSELLGQLFGRRSSSGGESSPGLAAAAFPNVSFDRVLGLLLEKTRPSPNAPGQEERDCYWGQLFGLQCFVESGILFGPGDADGRRWAAVLRHLLQLGRKKVWLRPEACYVVVLALARGHLPDEKAAAATLRTVATTSTTATTGADEDGGAGATVSATAPASLARTPEGLGIWLAALQRFPAMALPPPWTAPLAPGSFKDIVAVLRSSGGSEQPADADGGSSEARPGPAVKQGNASGQLPFVWDLLLRELLADGGGRQAALGQCGVDAFWVAVVDQVYFAKGASDHQKLTGFKVFQKALALCAEAAAARTGRADTDTDTATDAVRPSLFSSNLMTCLMNQAPNRTPRLHRAAVQVLKGIEQQVEQQPRALLAPVLACLLGCAPQAHGVYDLDERVKGTSDGIRPVERILRLADADTIADVLRVLRAGALQAVHRTNDQKPLRIYAEYLFRLSSRAGCSDPKRPASVGGRAFQALAALAYPSEKDGRPEAAPQTGTDKPDKQDKKDKKHKKDKKSKARDAAADHAAAATLPALDDKTQAASRQFLLSAAGALLKRPEDFAVFCRTVRSIEPGAVGVAVTGGEIQTHVAAARRQLKRLLAAFAAETDGDGDGDGDGHGDAVARARQGLAVLLAVSLLQLYHEPRADAIEVLGDIQACADKLEAMETRGGSVDSEEGSGEPDVGQVLNDVLLALLAESSQLTRQTSLQVFEAFTPFMTAAALDSLADVLAAEENTSGYRALFDPEGDQEEEEEEEDEEEDDDVEEMDVDEKTSSESGSGSSSESDDDSDGSNSSDDSNAESAGDSDGGANKARPNGTGRAALAAKKRSAAAVDEDGFEAALRQTFGKGRGADDDDDDGDDDGSGSDESTMSDDAMLALDEQLAGHLALLRSKADKHKKEREDARKRVVGFKHRVLDLLETYVKKEAASAAQTVAGGGGGQLVLLFRLLLPLVVLVRDTKEPALANKAAHIVQEMQRQLKRGRSSSSSSAAAAASHQIDPAAVDTSLGVLAALHEAANDRAGSRAAFAAAVSAGSLAIASALWAADRALYRRVADAYRATQDRWVLDGWSVRSSLFSDWHNWCQNAARVQAAAAGLPAEAA